MIRVGIAVALVVVAAACTGFVVDSAATTTAEPVSSTTTTKPTTTTTTAPTTTTTVPLLSVAGKVSGPDGEPVAGARVELAGSTVTTGDDGFFGLETTGEGTLTATKPGWTTREVEWSADTGFVRVSIEPRLIRGVRVGAEAAADDRFFRRLLALAEKTAVNAFVFDSKQEGGAVLYETSVREAHEIGAVDARYDPVGRLEQAEAAGLYTITRIVVFEDPRRVRARPEEKLVGRWVDPRSRSAWDYNIALAVEACEIGFDEIQFDYVRYPAGRTATVSGQLRLTEEERVAAIEGFLASAREALHPLGCAISADVFAIVVSMTDDQGLGQRPEELSRQLDALSPMIYPSHYSPGWLGYADPNDFPYEVTARAIDDAIPRVASPAVLRPWLQAFYWSSPEIRRSIQAAEDRGVGWILWNVASNFDVASLPTTEEVTDP